MTRPGNRAVRVGEMAAYRRLGMAWAAWGIAGGLGLLLTAAVLRGEFGPRVGLWLVIDAAALVGILAMIRQALPDNRATADGPLLRALGPGNQLTILRGMLIAQLPGYLALAWPSGWAAWLPAVTYGVAQTADFFDGYLARRADRATRLGERLDIEFDGLGLMAATGLAVHYGQMPLIYFLTVGLARYFFLATGWYARRAGRNTHAIPPSTTRRGLAGAVMELGVVALWPIAPQPLMTVGAGLIGIPVLAGFARDTLIFIGLLDPLQPTYLAVRKRIVWFFSVALPVVVRLGLALVLGPELIERWGEGGLPPPAVVLASILLLMIVVGAAGRAAAAGLIVVIGFDQALAGVSTEGVAAWGLALAIYVFGTGAGSLWQPELILVQRRAGERR